MSHFHAVVWIDHREARIFRFNADAAEALTLRAHHVRKAGHADESYLREVAAALEDAGEVLVTGPAGAKMDLVRHVGRHDPHLLARIAGVETSDHPTDAQIVAHARRYFQAADRTTAQKV